MKAGVSGRVRDGWWRLLERGRVGPPCAAGPRGAALPALGLGGSSLHCCAVCVGPMNR